MKKLVLLFILSIFLTTFMYAYDFAVANSDNVTIYYNRNRTNATVTYQQPYSVNYKGTYDGSIVIPSEVIYGGTTYNVTSIGMWAFESCNGLTSITIPNSVTSIGTLAFFDCKGLVSVIIPNSVITIGSYAFQGCSELTSLVIGNSVNNIGGKAFLNCFKITSLNIPNSVTTIEGYAFAGCSGLSGTLTIPNSVTAIGDYAFTGCRGLTSLFIGNSVTAIGYRAFDGCTGLKNVTLEEGTKTLSLEPYNSAPSTFADCPIENLYLGRDIIYYSSYSPFRDITTLKSLTILNSITSIGSYAFRGCSGLTGTLTIPNSVITIGLCAFEGCSRVTSLIIGNSVNSIGDNAFFQCSSMMEIYSKNPIPPKGGNNRMFEYVVTQVCPLNVPVGAKALYEVALHWRDFKTIVEQSVTAIPTFLVETFAFINRNWLYINSPVAETVRVYLLNGTLLHSFSKHEGNTSYLMNGAPNSILIVEGSSGWVKKISYGKFY